MANRFFSSGIATAVLLCGTILSCRNPFSQTETVSFLLPAWPPHNAENTSYPVLVRWEIRWHDGYTSGQIQTDAGCSAVRLEIQRNIPCAVTARPVTIRGNTEELFFFPAGCMYPFTESVAWEDGFAAATAYRLYAESATDHNSTENAQFLAQFNWERFITQLHIAETEDTAFNPWLIDEKKLEEAIAARTFSVSLLHVKKNKTLNSSRILRTASAYLPAENKQTEELLLHSYIPAQKGIDDEDSVSVLPDTVISFFIPPSTIAAVTPDSSGGYTLVIIPAAE